MSEGKFTTEPKEHHIKTKIKDLRTKIKKSNLSEEKPKTSKQRKPDHERELQAALKERMDKRKRNFPGQD